MKLERDENRIKLVFLNTKEVVRIYSSEFSVKWENYNQDTGNILLNINGKIYTVYSVPEKDFQEFRRRLNLNRGKALKFLKDSYRIERKPEESSERASDEDFNKWIGEMEAL